MSKLGRRPLLFRMLILAWVRTTTRWRIRRRYFDQRERVAYEASLLALKTQARHYDGVGTRL